MPLNVRGNVLLPSKPNQFSLFLLIAPYTTIQVGMISYNTMMKAPKTIVCQFTLCTKPGTTITTTDRCIQIIQKPLQIIEQKQKQLAKLRIGGAEYERCTNSVHMGCACCEATTKPGLRKRN